MLEAVWVVDPKSLRILEVNGLAASLVGMSRDACVGKPVIEFTATPEDMFFSKLMNTLSVITSHNGL
jgi:PAS domain-containing protein